MEEDQFSLNELREPKPMKLYWALLRGDRSKKTYNCLILILKVTEKSIKLIPLKRGELSDHYPVRFIAKRHFKITGLANDVCNYNYNDFLTCDSEVIRKHAIEHFRNQQLQ